MGVCPLLTCSQLRLTLTACRMRGSAPPSTSTQDEDDHRGHSVNVTELNQTAQRVNIFANKKQMHCLCTLVFVNDCLQAMPC